MNLVDLHAFMHDCSETPRISGSDIYLIRNNRPIMVGMNVGVQDQAHNVDDGTEIDYSLPYANIAVDGSVVRLALEEYQAGGLIVPVHPSK